jgi:hypothetical protein
VQILVFGNIKLQSGRLPDECLRDIQDPIHIVPADVEAQTFFTVTVIVCLPVLLLTVAAWGENSSDGGSIWPPILYDCGRAKVETIYDLSTSTFQNSD